VASERNMAPQIDSGIAAAPFRFFLIQSGSVAHRQGTSKDYGCD
jgi:hypothetical protein